MSAKNEFLFQVAEYTIVYDGVQFKLTDATRTDHGKLLNGGQYVILKDSLKTLDSLLRMAMDRLQTLDEDDPEDV